MRTDVDRPRDELLAGSAFARDQDGQIVALQAVNLFDHARHRRARAEEARQQWFQRVIGGGPGCARAVARGTQRETLASDRGNHPQRGEPRDAPNGCGDAMAPSRGPSAISTERLEDACRGRGRVALRRPSARGSVRHRHRSRPRRRPARRHRGADIDDGRGPRSLLRAARRRSRDRAIQATRRRRQCVARWHRRRRPGEMTYCRCRSWSEAARAASRVVRSRSAPSCWKMLTRLVQMPLGDGAGPVAATSDRARGG